MHPAEFKTLREAIGLSISTLVKVIDVDERTLRKWESGKKKLPQGVIDSLVGIDDLLNKTAAHIFKTEKEALDKRDDSSVVLKRFIEEEDLLNAFPEFEGLPMTSVGVVLFRVRQKFIDLGMSVSIIYS
jgi:transcriptional regulator with XRE-family HTH domain